MLTENTVDRDGQQKLYVQVYGSIKDKIERCQWPVSAQIPTEDDLCITYDVSKATVRIAISNLVRDGYLRRQQGKGTFVASSMPHMGMVMRTIFTEDMFGEGVKAKKEVLVKGIKEPPEDIKEYLKAKDDIFYVFLKRLVDGEPAYVEESFIPLQVFPGVASEDISRASFYDLIQEKAVRKIFKVVQTIEITMLRGDIAAVLKRPEGSPALLLHRLLLGSNEIPMAYTRLTGISGKYKIQTEFERVK